MRGHVRSETRNLVLERTGELRRDNPWSGAGNGRAIAPASLQRRDAA